MPWSPIAVVILFGGALMLLLQVEPQPDMLEGTAWVIDGDTIDIGPARVRILGIDAPELDQICWDADGMEWRCGRAARDRLAELVRGTPVTCSPQGRDKYRRVLASCTAGEVDVAAVLVREGWAIAEIEYKLEEVAARRAGSGIWAGRFDTPRKWRDEGPSGPGPVGLLDWLWDWLGQLTSARNLL